MCDQHRKIFRIYFRKSASGYYVFAKVEVGNTAGYRYVILNDGREIAPDRALAYAKRYIASRNQFEYEFSIDESALNGEGE